MKISFTGQPKTIWSKADLHIHTIYSDGLMDPAENIEYIAHHTSLKVIAITDHDTAEGAFATRAYARRHAPHLEVIIGQEVTTEEGELLGLFLQSSLPVFKTAAEAIEAIHQQGGCWRSMLSRSLTRGRQEQASWPLLAR